MIFDINPRNIYTISKKEFMDNVRNKWIILLTVIFALLTILISYFGATQSGGNVGFHGFESTVLGMTSITSMLIPLIAIMLGYGAVVGERENGSLQVVLACPVSRYDLIIGKFIGLGCVISTTIILGFGIAGILIAALSTGTDWLKYIAFIFCTIIFTMLYLGFAIFMSTIASKRSTAIAGGVLIFFSGMILGIIMIGVWVATSGNNLMDYVSGDITELPGWMWVVEHINFMDAYPLGAMMIFGITQFFGYTMVMPDWMSAWSIFGVQLGIAIILFLLSLIIMKKKDV